MNKERYPLVMTEQFWANTHLSVARYTGRIRLGQYDYVICNKDGKDIFECSWEAAKAGAKKAIEPGEPADLAVQVNNYYLCGKYQRLWEKKRAN